MVSPPGVWPPSSAYKLQRPCKPGWGMMTLRPWPGGGQLALRAALSRLVERWPEYDEDPLGGGGGRGNSATTGWCHTGTLGLHLVTLASSSSAPTAGLGLKERRSLRSSGPQG